MDDLETAELGGFSATAGKVLEVKSDGKVEESKKEFRDPAMPTPEEYAALTAPIEDLEFDQVTDETGDKKKKKEEVEEEDETITEESETQVEEETEEEITEEEGTKEEEVTTEEVAPTPEYKIVEPSKEEIEVQSKQKLLTKEIQMLDSVLDEEPSKPADPDDEAAMQRYLTRLEDWQDRVKRAETKKEQKRAELMAEARKAQTLFFKKHPELTTEDKQELSNYAANSAIYYTAWVTGETKLESLYKLWLDETGRKISKPKVPAKAQDAKATPITKKPLKPVSTATKGVDNKSVAKKGKNGLPSKYVYANKPEMAEWVAEYLDFVSPFTKKKYTHDEIEQLAKQEYNLWYKK